MKSETALYRKYRPEKFKDVIGQDQVVRVLEASLKEGNVFHAYLFVGSRGTGKTSVARILARELGCAPEDIYEIDAASNRGIDDIREIRDAVNTLPYRSPYKVYIVDEVHMLTKEAWNAFLKTLEEPPSHVLFVMATTEMEKVPETVLSRCQVFQFKKPNRKMLKEMVMAVAKKEGFTLAPTSADLVAMLADGSFRDAQGILQKVLSISKDKKVDQSEVLAVTGAPRAELVNDTLTAIAEKNIAGALSGLRAAGEENIEPRVFLKMLLEKMRAVLLARNAPDLKKGLSEDFSDDDFALIEKLAGERANGVNGRTLAELLTAYEQIPYAYIPELPIELALGRALNTEKQS